MMDWESADHCGGPRILAWSEVISVGSPPEDGMRRISSWKPDCWLRTKRRRLPSGEKEQPQSCESGGDCVSWSGEELSSGSRTRPEAEEKRIDLPSGNQEISRRMGENEPVSSLRSDDGEAVFVGAKGMT